jgi:ABC-type polysaccharide/polyol phosphate transport system ATPase subunit
VIEADCSSETGSHELPVPFAAAAIEVVGLSKHCGSTVAVDDLSFTVPYGRVVGFLGPNGAGKPGVTPNDSNRSFSN